MKAQSVAIVTNLGSFTITLDTARAPATVANFLRYVDDGHYDDTVFHRVIAGFMVQGGGYDTSFEKKPTLPPVHNEADNGVKNRRATVAMARTADPHSATAQFFINLVDNAFLDHTEMTSRGWGYAVFGTVTEGMDVVDRIASSPTGHAGPFAKDAPLSPIVIQSARRI